MYPKDEPATEVMNKVLQASSGENNLCEEMFANGTYQLLASTMFALLSELNVPNDMVCSSKLFHQDAIKHLLSIMLICTSIFLYGTSMSCTKDFLTCLH